MRARSLLHAAVLSAVALLSATDAVRAQDSILSGDYYSAYFETSEGRTRFFAVKFTGDFNEKTIEDAARRGCRIVEWKRVSLAPQGVLDQRLPRQDQHYVVGAYCLGTDKCYWVAIGHEAPNHLNTIRTNSGIRSQSEHPKPRGWQWDDRSGGWKARIEENGWHLELFTKEIQLGIGLLPDPSRSLTYTFFVKGNSVRVATDRSDYQVDTINPRDTLNPRSLLGSQDGTYRFYALEVRGQRVRERTFKEAVEFGLDHVRGRGLTLGADPEMPPGKMYLAKLPDDATLILGAYHPTRDKSFWLTLSIDSATRKIFVSSLHGFEQTADLRYEAKSGGRKVELRIFPDTVPNIGFLFLEPESAYGEATFPVGSTLTQPAPVTDPTHLPSGPPAGVTDIETVSPGSPHPSVAPPSRRLILDGPVPR